MQGRGNLVQNLIAAGGVKATVPQAAASIERRPGHYQHAAGGRGSGGVGVFDQPRSNYQIHKNQNESSKEGVLLSLTQEPGTLRFY